MGDRFTLKDLWFFIKSNMKIILGITLLFLILIISYVVFQNVGEPSSEPQQEDQDELFEYTVPEVHELLLLEDELSGREQTAVREVLENDMVYFRVFIENHDYTVFNRRHLLKEILLHDEITSALDLTFGFNQELLEDFVQVDLDTDTGIFSIEFTTGEEQQNLELANAYYDLLSTEEVSIMSERDLYFFDEPQTYSSQEEADSQAIEEEAEPIDVINIVYFIMGGLVFGIVFGILASIVISIYKKSISMIYNFSLNNKDKVINLTRFRHSKEQNDNIIEAISYPPNVNRAVLVEEGSVELTDLKNQNSTFNVLHHFSKIRPDITLNEVVLVVKINETSKEWYETQLTLVKGNNIPLKVVKV